MNRKFKVGDKVRSTVHGLSWMVGVVVDINDYTCLAPPYVIKWENQKRIFWEREEDLNSGYDRENMFEEAE